MRYHAPCEAAGSPTSTLSAVPASCAPQLPATLNSDGGSIEEPSFYWWGKGLGSNFLFPYNPHPHPSRQTPRPSHPRAWFRPISGPFRLRLGPFGSVSGLFQVRFGSASVLGGVRVRGFSVREKNITRLGPQWASDFPRLVVGNFNVEGPQAVLQPIALLAWLPSDRKSLPFTPKFLQINSPPVFFL